MDGSRVIRHDSSALGLFPVGVRLCRPLRLDMLQTLPFFHLQMATRAFLSYEAANPALFVDNGKGNSIGRMLTI